jgi:hypothetical protein
MHLAYVDESGSVGVGSSLTFTLACVLVDATRWPDVFDEILDYRRFLKSTFGVPVRAEIKANHLLRNGGAFRPLGLSEGARFRIYRGLMRLQQKLELLAFAIVIRKDVMATRGDYRQSARYCMGIFTPTSRTLHNVRRHAYLAFS